MRRHDLIRKLDRLERLAVPDDSQALILGIRAFLILGCPSSTRSAPRSEQGDLKRAAIEALNQQSREPGSLQAKLLGWLLDQPSRK